MICYMYNNVHSEPLKKIRPLTGILFFTPLMMNKYSFMVKPFPSPYGDFVFQLRAEELKRKEESFRPLTGILFFNFEEK